MASPSRLPGGDRWNPTRFGPKKPVGYDDDVKFWEIKDSFGREIRVECIQKNKQYDFYLEDEFVMSYYGVKPSDSTVCVLVLQNRPANP
jgi:hypothetical protein